MAPLNVLMNRVADLSDSKSFFKKQILTRALVVTACLPVEVLSTAQNLIKLPYQAIQTAIKIPAKIINLGVRSSSLREFEMKLTGPFQLMKTAIKVISYIIGTLFTATLGIISPYRNFRLHAALDLVKDIKAEKARRDGELNAAKQRETEKAIMQMHIKNLLLAQRLKNAEKERLYAQQALQHKESQQVVTQDPKPISEATLVLDRTTPSPAELVTNVAPEIEEKSLKIQSAKPKFHLFPKLNKSSI